MAKEKTLKVQTEVKALQNILDKLQAKYLDTPSKELSDTLTHLQSAMNSIKKI